MIKYGVFFTFLKEKSPFSPLLVKFTNVESFGLRSITVAKTVTSPEVSVTIPFMVTREVVWAKLLGRKKRISSEVQNRILRKFGFIRNVAVMF